MPAVISEIENILALAPTTHRWDNGRDGANVVRATWGKGYDPFRLPTVPQGIPSRRQARGPKAKCPDCNGVLSIPAAGTNSHQCPSQRAAALSPPSPASSPKPLRGASAAVVAGGPRGNDSQVASAQARSQVAANEADEPTGLGTATKVVMGVCGTICMVLIGWFVWYVAIRDTLETDHRADVLALSKDTVKLTAARDAAGSVKKYEELLALVGKRKLNDAELVKAIADAREAAEPAKRQIDGERTLSSVHGLEEQAKAFVDSGDFQSGIEKYKQVAGFD